ncbi:unnamed protein product [Porites evermanni]|uniref:Protein aurora borealis n=1 Tax=Porites evermanni TaxID=104178 RepID=A0ABN8LIW6_9CNID|nr:unnamed protein product [Porites evermanni]
MVDSMCTLSSLEVTRNPFDSNQEERVNCPGFSPSMFRKQETPASQKKSRSFRWSIDQISRLNPADIDEFPCQEYSSTFERLVLIN